ncbi:hypothetical protein Tco_0385957 [Tanacetum coccineum]
MRLLSSIEAQLVDTTTESDLEEAPSEVEELQPLGSRVPLMSEEFEASEPSDTRTVSSHSLVSSDSTTPLSPDHPLTHVSPTPTPTQVLYHQAMALSDSAFCKSYRSSYETPSSLPSPTLLVQKRYCSTFELILDTDSEGGKLGDEDTEEDVEDESQGLDDESQGLDDKSQGLDDESQGLDDESLGLDDKSLSLDDESQGLEEEGPGMEEEEEEAAPEDQQQAFPVVDTAASEPLGLGYGEARRPALESTEKITLRAQLELYGSILHDYTQRLDALPPTLVVDIDRDVRELYTRSGAVRDEIFSLVLELEAWAGHFDTRLENMSRARYDDHRLIHDMLVQQAAMQRKLQEMRGSVTALEQERGRREP